MSKNGAGYDTDIEDVPNDLYDEKQLFVMKFIKYAKKLSTERTLKPC